MLPSEFLNRFGGAVPKVLTISTADPVIIAADQHRYLLCFWSATSNLGIQPNIPGEVISSSFVFGASSAPLFLSHSVHGALVNMGWRITSILVPNELVYIAATMSNLYDHDIANGGINGDENQKQKRGRRGSVRTGHRP